MIPALLSFNLTIAPLTLLQQGRVATGDHIGQRLQGRLSILLIGERPGLSSADSMGAYLTFQPAPGLTDVSRNCISNIRPEGLALTLASSKIIHLTMESLRLGISGVNLKDNAPLLS